MSRKPDLDCNGGLWLPAPLMPCGFGYEILNKTSQGRIFEAYFDIMTDALKRYSKHLPFTTEVPKGTTLRDWIGLLNPRQIEAVKNCWLADCRGYVDRCP